MFIIAMLIIEAILLVASILLAPKVHQPASQAQQTPTASAGSPIPRVYGRVWIAPNSIWYGEISEYARKVKTSN